MNASDIIGYTYDADIHCPDCARAAGMDLEDATDTEGNTPGAVFASEEFDCPQCCGTCAGDIDANVIESNQRTVYNPSTCKEEKAELVQCPRCKGCGGCFGDDDGCTLCKKDCYVFKSSGGWVWPESGSPEEGRLY